MAEALVTGDEPGAERGDDGTVVEQCAVEHLERGPRGVLERDRLLDPALVGLGLRQLLDRDTGGVQGGLDLLEGAVVAHLPADRQDAIHIVGDDDDSGRPLVHAQIQSRRIGTGAFGEAQDPEGELTPPLDVAGRDGEVAEAFDRAHRFPSH